jgi:hypothetical protein
LEGQLKCGTVTKDLKEKAAVNAGCLGDLLADILLSLIKI